MHDLFDILGVRPNARAADIHRLCGRHAPQPHPEIDPLDADGRALGGIAVDAYRRASPDGACAPVDFARVGPLVGRMRDMFFGRSRPREPQWAGYRNLPASEP